MEGVGSVGQERKGFVGANGPALRNQTRPTERKLTREKRLVAGQKSQSSRDSSLQPRVCFLPALFFCPHFSANFSRVSYAPQTFPRRPSAVCHPRTRPIPCGRSHRLTPHPAAWKGATLAGSTATLTAEKWSSLRSPTDFADAQISATVTITEAAKSETFFGQSWSAWPDPTFSDGGFDAGVLLRAGTNSGYRIQLSHRYQVVALVKWPEGGYVRVVPCVVKLKEPHQLVATAQGSLIGVSVDGAQKIQWQDAFLPLTSGAVGIAANGGAKVTCSNVSVGKLGFLTRPPPPAHTPNFAVRPFLGGRQFVFDGDEPILQLHHEKDPSMFAKLRPGYKPQLTWDSHWDLANQGAFKDADSKWTAPVTSGGGASLKATWSARSVKDRFTTQSISRLATMPNAALTLMTLRARWRCCPANPSIFAMASTSSITPRSIPSAGSIW